MDLLEAVFMQGQLYAVLFRAFTGAGVRKLIKLDAQRLTNNIVFPKMLLRLPADT